MADVDSVTEWIGQLKAGDQSAAQHLWQRYVDRLVRLARGRLRRTSRRVADEEDLANSAIAGCFGGIQAGRFPRMDDRDDLWQVLVVLTERKSVDYRRRASAAKRGAGAVRGESVFAGQDGGASSRGGLSQVIDSMPTPAFATQAAEELQRLLNLLGDAALRRLALAKMEGYSNEEIARQHDMSLSSIERKLRLIRKTWEEAAEP